jgi:septum formation protein
VDGAARPVLGSDTVVVADGVVYGKPLDRPDGLAMLAALSGRTHQVMTAVALATAGGVAQKLSRTQVTMRGISPAEAAAYWDTGEPQGKAGGYAIQGRGALFIEHISGSYSGVMGLPLYETAQLLQILQPGRGSQ